MNTFINYIYRFFAPLSPAQKFLFGLLSAGIVLSMSFLTYWALSPDYNLLFGSLPPKAAQTIVDQLKTEGIPYQLRENGQSIYVPKDKVYNLRLQFSSQGVTDSEIKGYELFDATTLGMTDFMQKVNLKRALEGELSRTITNLEQVEYGRVHLVLPERSPFVETSIDPSASVIVTLKRGKRLDGSQIEGISSLVAGSVEGLSTNNVVILDENGNKISQNEEMNSDIALSSAQMKIRQAAEGYLQSKAQSMLDRIVGPGNSILRVSTQHDFEKIKRQSDLIDPDSRIIISEEMRSENLQDERYFQKKDDPNTPQALRNSDPGMQANNRQGSQIRIRNYEVNTTKEQYEKPVGEITKISASILLNQKKQTVVDQDGVESVQALPWTQAELNEVTNLVRTALGINEVRGDEISVTQFTFEETFDSTYLDEQRQYEEQMKYTELIRWVIIIAALTFAFYVLYRILRQNYPEAIPPLFFDSKPEISGKGQTDDAQKTISAGDNDLPITEQDTLVNLPGDIEKATDVYRRKLSPEAQRRLEMKSKMFEEIKNFAEYKPDEAANMIRSLMMQKRD